MSKRTKIEQDFRTLLKIIEEQRPEYTAGIGTGLSDEEVEKCIKIHPIPEGLFAIYSCVKGGYFCSEDYSTYFLPGYYYLLDINSINAEIKGCEEIIVKFNPSYYSQNEIEPPSER
jgi:hypothetical protein